MSRFKTPKFWYSSEDSYISKLLMPFSKIYELSNSLKLNNAITKKINKPVICIGSILHGGAGKTPVVKFVAELLNRKKYNPHILASGKAGYIRNVMRVDSSKHSYLQVGDEPILSSEVCPTWIGKDRVKSAEAAILAGADIIIVDSGFLDNSLEKDLQILVIDSTQKFGNQHIFPAGPLIESINSGIQKADAILIIGVQNSALEEKIYTLKNNVPVFYAKMDPDSSVNVKKGDKVIAFCGLGYPEKFKKTLEKMELSILDFIAFADHHPYTFTEVQKLIRVSKNSHTKLVTTRKDYIKIPEIFRNEINVIDIKLSFTGKAFSDIILKAAATTIKSH
ncbi:MAG: tetraacyldisaccharide 4'-kinase [Holosporales bacterium]|jgi:tetraacyldisaccharide 4'-kinase|nr:tetraacyldisaccharide 4'-kinase [Holosporales bacterium]